MIDKNKKKETVKAEPKKMPERGSSERGSSERIDSQKLKENQAPNKFSHRPSKEETYKPKITEAPKADKL